MCASPLILFFCEERGNVVSQTSSMPIKPGSTAEQLYESIRLQVETPEQIGRLIVMDLESGDYEIDGSGDDIGLEATRRLQSRHPGVSLHALRIGYRTAVSFCGALERTEVQ